MTYARLCRTDSFLVVKEIYTTVKQTAEVGSENRDEYPECQQERHTAAAHFSASIALGTDRRDDQPDCGGRPEPAVGHQELGRPPPVSIRREKPSQPPPPDRGSTTPP